MAIESRSWRDIVAAAGALAARPASARAVASLDGAGLGDLPVDLLALLRESNGVRTAAGDHVVWPVSDIVAKNHEYRDPGGFAASLYAPFDTLLLLGEAGDGDLYGVDLAGGSGGIVVWEHETDERTPYAADLTAYIERRAHETAGRSAAGGHVGSVERGVVSIWAGDLARDVFDGYLEMGGSGRVVDGLPLSRFQADAGLTLADVIATTQQALHVGDAQPLDIAIADMPGAGAFGLDAVRDARSAGRPAVTCAILLYGLRYDPARAASATLTFIGSYDVE